jgi:hypothetical protein
MNTMLMTHAEEYKCHILPVYWHTLHFVALNEDGYVNCYKAHLSKMVNPRYRNTESKFGRLGAAARKEALWHVFLFV